MNDEADLSFAVINTGRLREAGLVGTQANVVFKDDAFEFTGQDSGGVRLAASNVDRIRVGYEEGKQGRHFQTLIWPRGEQAPIVIHPLGNDRASYGAAIRAFAASLAQAQGLGRVERGVSGASALFGLILGSLPAVMFTALALYLAKPSDWLGWLGGGVVAWGFSGLMIARYPILRPRPVRDLRELERYTPPPRAQQVARKA
jgi:hypothetical protein